MVTEALKRQTKIGKAPLPEAEWHLKNCKIDSVEFDLRSHWIAAKERNLGLLRVSDSQSAVLNMQTVACLSVVVVLCSAGSVNAELQFRPQQNEPRRFHNTHSPSTGEVIGELAKRVEDLLIKEDRPYSFPIRWQQDKGMYPSNIKINFAGVPYMAAVRDSFSVFDNNMFATSWITTCILEAHLYAKAPRPTDTQLSMALEAIGRYHDKNRGYNTSLMTFWPQVYNESTKMWESSPSNLFRAFAFFDVVPAKYVEEILKLLGLTAIEHELEKILSMRAITERAFRIPPDFDDSFVNVGLGALLLDLGGEFPDAVALWVGQNPNVMSLVEALRQYAYRPFSGDQNVNTIDPRTFYYMRHFLGEAEARKEDIALVPTWVQNIDEVKKDYYRGVAMPFQINNVDVTVAANTIYGITAGVLSNILSITVLDDPIIKQVYVNTSSLVAHQIMHHLYDRPDLELTYYPSVFEFYWFSARTYAILETALLRVHLTEAMREVHRILKPALEGTMTSDVMKKAKAMGPDMLYFDDFLGDGDVDEHNRTLIRGEDRLFTTSVAVNALLSTWTLYNSVNRTITWKRSAPAEVRDTVDKAVKFLNTYILRDTFKPWNVFFSGSAKGRSTLPFSYPVNRLEFLNGTAIHDDQHFPRDPFLLGVRGFIPESEYRVLLQKKHFGMKTPTTFAGFNAPDSTFPFWTSTAYTYANTMLALSRYDSIIQ